MANDLARNFLSAVLAFPPIGAALNRTTAWPALGSPQPVFFERVMTLQVKRTLSSATDFNVTARLRTTSAR